MALAPSDERDLLIPLYSGIQADSLWDIFLRRLLARTGGERISLFVTSAASGKRVLYQRILFAPGAPARAAIDMDDFADSILLAYGSPRPNRVYSLEELLIRDDSDAARQQAAALARAGISFARFIRIPTPGDHMAWLFLMDDRQDFRAADSALLSALAPHVAVAIGLLLEADGLRLRATMAEEALAMLGVGQAAFDVEGRIVAADAVAAAELDVQANGRPRLRPREEQALGAACAALAATPAHRRQVVRIDERETRDMLLRPAPQVPRGLPDGATAVGLIRRPRREQEAAAARVVAATLGLSDREAALAEKISRGQSILAGGAALQLTPETARNYSKRIYAKTGASGQADLVRLLLTGLAPFA